jgi:hypothetical protein
MLEVDEIMSILRTTVDRLRELAANLAPEQLAPAAYEGDWTVTAVLAHLRACNDVLGSNIVRIVQEDRPAWRAMSPRTWQQRSGYHDLAFAPAFGAFAAARTKLLEVLEPLAPADWERTATVTVPPKKVFEYTARYYGDWLAAHERAHLRHLARTLRPDS